MRSTIIARTSPSNSQNSTGNAHPQNRREMVIFTGNSNDALAKEIAEILKIELGNIKVGRFNDGEVSIEVKDNVRSKNVYIIQSTSPPVN